MRLLKNMAIVLLIFVHSSVFSTSPVERAIQQAKIDLSEIIIRYHLLLASKSDSLLSSQNYNICAVAIITPEGRRMDLVLADTSGDLQIPKALVGVCEELEQLNTNIAIFKNGGTSAINKQIATMVQENFGALASDKTNNYFSAISEQAKKMRDPITTSHTLKDGAARHTDAEERALYAIQLLIDSNKISQGSTIVLVSLMDTCKFCACSAAGLVRKYNKLFKEIKIFYVVDYSFKCEKDLSNFGVTREQINSFHTKSCMFATKQALSKKFLAELNKPEFADWFAKEGFRSLVVLQNNELKEILTDQLRSFKFTTVSKEFANWFINYCITEYVKHRDITESLLGNSSFIRSLCTVIKLISLPQQLPSEFVGWMMEKGDKASMLLTEPSLSEPLFKTLKILKKYPQMNSDFIRIFIENFTEENIWLYESLFVKPEFVVQLSESLKCSNSLKVNEQFASWFVNLIMMNDNCQPAIELLDIPLFVDAINKLQKFDIWDAKLVKFVDDDKFREPRVSLLRLTPFVICVADCFKKTLNINELILFIQWSLRNGLPLSAAPLFNVPQTIALLEEVFTKKPPEIMHADFACAFIVGCREQKYLRKLFRITQFVNTLRSALMKSKLPVLENFQNFASWFISLITTKGCGVNDNRIAAMKLLEIPIIINSLNRMQVNVTSDFELAVQFFLEDDNFRAPRRGLLNLKQFVDSLYKKFLEKNYNYDNFVLWSLKNGLPTLASRLFSISNFMNALEKIFGKSGSLPPKTMNPEFACSFIIGCQEQNSEQWKQLMKNHEFVNILHTALEKSKAIVLQISPYFANWLIPLIIDQKKAETEVCKEVLELLDIPLFFKSFNAVLYLSGDGPIPNINDLLKFIVSTEFDGLKQSQQLLQLRLSLLRKILIKFKGDWVIAVSFIKWFMENSNESILNTAFSNGKFSNSFYGIFEKSNDITTTHDFAYQFMQYYYSLPKRQRPFDWEKTSHPFVMALKKTLGKDEVEKVKKDVEALQTKKTEMLKKHRHLSLQKAILLSPFSIKPQQYEEKVKPRTILIDTVGANIEEIIMPGDGDCGYHALNIGCSVPNTQSNSRELLITQLLSVLDTSQAQQVRQLIAQEITDRIIAGDLDELIFNLLGTDNYQLSANILNAMALGDQVSLDALTQNTIIVELYLNTIMLWGRMRHPDGWLQFSPRHNEITRTGIGDAIAFLLRRNLTVVEGRSMHNIGEIIHEYRCPGALDTIYLIQTTDNHYNRGQVIQGIQ